MSESDSGPGQREVAYRLFAAEFEDADLDHSESDEERAPNYVITPTGARVNRLFVVGVLTEVEPVSDDVLRARVVDPTGAFVLYAGQYQQDERAFLERADPPTFVAVTGKARTFQPEDSDRVFTSVRPESMSEVDGDTRARWTVDAAEQTLDRVETAAMAIALGAEGDALRQALDDRGVEEGLADGVALALDHYGTTPTYLAAVRDLALDAARVVAGDREEVTGLAASPDEAGDVTATDLLSEPVEPLDVDAEPAAGAEPSPTEGAFEADEEPDETELDAEGIDEAPTAETDPGPVQSPEGEAESEPDHESEPEPESDPESEPEAGSTEASAETATTDEEPEAETSEPEREAPDPDDADEGPGDFEPGEFDLDDSEREEIEEEYGTEFQSGTEVDDPGEADIETPDPEEVDAAAAEGAVAAESAQAPETHTSEAGEAPAAADEAADGADGPADVDLEDAVVAAMESLDEGDGAGRDAVVAAVTERTGADADAVAEAIQDALMDGRCYEPEDDRYKPI